MHHYWLSCKGDETQIKDEDDFLNLTVYGLRLHRKRLTEGEECKFLQKTLSNILTYVHLLSRSCIDFVTSLRLRVFLTTNRVPIIAGLTVARR